MVDEAALTAGLVAGGILHAEVIRQRRLNLHGRLHAMPLTRRSWLEIACAALASFRATASPRVPAVSGMTALTNRAHFLAPPGVRRELVECFETVLGCGPPIALAAPGKSEPILAFRFPGGGSVSVEFTSEALEEASARRGAWLEVRPRDPAEFVRRVREAGLPQVHYWATKTFYFVVPGGQVFGVYRSDELR